MQLDHSKGMPVHVLTCISYDFNALTLIVWKLWSWYNVFLHCITKM